MAGFNDLRKAVKARNCARLRQLVRGGADIHCRDSMKRTVLHYAAANRRLDGMKDVIKTLVYLGADINAGDIYGMRPIHCCQFIHHKNGTADETASAMAFLISLGADVNAKFDVNRTSLHRAIRLNNILGLETLLRLGVDANVDKQINFTALHIAIKMKWMTLVEFLVRQGADVNSSMTIFPPLLQAIELGRLDIVKLLVEHGANVNAERKDNFTPVTYAVLGKRLPQVLTCLVQFGADLNAKLSASSTVYEVVKVGRVDILEYLVRHGADIIYPRFQQTALGLAVQEDSYEMVHSLLRVRNVNGRYNTLLSPFATAMRLGDTEMVRALKKLQCLQKIDNITYAFENTTLLHQACGKDPKFMNLLLKYGGDFNLKYDASLQLGLVHEAVALGNGKMLRVLAEAGENLNQPKREGVGLIHHIIQTMRGGNADKVAFIKMLVEAGIDLNQCCNENVTPLHVAVRLGDSEMVKILGELKADTTAKRIEGVTPLFLAITHGRTDLVRYFAENGSDVNSTTTGGLTPLHDAVRQGNVDITRILINSGADIKPKRQVHTALYHAIITGNNEVVKCLLEWGADINATICHRISALHDAVEKSDLGMIDVLTACRPSDNITDKLELETLDQFTPLEISIQGDHQDITETLLKHGADMNCLQHIAMSPLEVALDQGKLDCALLLNSRNLTACMDTESSPLHTACELGHTDLARLLIIEGSNVSKQDHLGKKPLEYLPVKESADYHVLQETVTAEKVTEQVLSSFVSTSGCQDMKTSLHTPGIGDVKYIFSPCATEVSQRVNQLLTSTIQQCKAFPGGKLCPIGSSAEGTRVGLPNEMDFLFWVQPAKDEVRTTLDLGNGYAKYAFVTELIGIVQQRWGINSISNQQLLSKEISGSEGFHNYFINEVNEEINCLDVSDEKVSAQERGSENIKETDRKACSLHRLQWKDGRSSFSIPVDIVPCPRIDDWPEGGTTRTWLMDEKELRSRGYVLVPKPPHVKSDLAKECTEEELRTLWKISFPHLETEHMQKLEQRVKDVYITAKCLKNPDVCRIMITDEGSLPRTVGKYVTSYQLKMCFFKNVEYFRQHHMSLEEMVCKVYDDLVLGLSKNFIPLFFLPKVSALSGIKIDVPKSLKVAKIMARFVRALYLRDSLGDIADSGDDMVMTVYQRDPGSVYRVYDISNEDF